MDRDPLDAKLRSMPALAPPIGLDAQVLLAAHAAMNAPPLQPSRANAWLYRLLVPTLLSSVSVAYLFWAVRAASALY